MQGICRYCFEAGEVDAKNRCRECAKFLDSKDEDLVNPLTGIFVKKMKGREDRLQKEIDDFNKVGMKSLQKAVKENQS